MSGGGNGWDHLNDEERSRIGRLGGLASTKRINEDEEYRKTHNERSSVRMTLTHKEGKISYDTFTGRKHTPETLERMRESHVGKHSGTKNSQFGKIWIKSEELQKSILVKKDDLQKFLDVGWILGRKIWGSAGTG